MSSQRRQRQKGRVGLRWERFPFWGMRWLEEILFELFLSGHLVQLFIHERFIEHPLVPGTVRMCFIPNFFDTGVIFLVKL